jgi:pimeloyl-ACP methyl ester carboxylesterase
LGGADRLSPRFRLSRTREQNRDPVGRLAAGLLPTPDLEQAQAYWYQWFLATARGAEAFRTNGKGFARWQWETWGPRWFNETEFEATAISFENPDWPEITLHSYRVRWGEAKPDPRYDRLETRAGTIATIEVPTLMIHGAADKCLLLASSEGKDRYFTRGYQRHILPAIGHFPCREASDAVSKLLIDFLSVTATS